MNLSEYRRSTVSVADFLPWAALVDEGIVLNKERVFPADRALSRARS